MTEDDNPTVVLKRLIPQEDVDAFISFHNRPCPYCGRLMTPFRVSVGDLLDRKNRSSLTGWVLIYACTCTYPASG